MRAPAFYLGLSALARRGRGRYAGYMTLLCAWLICAFTSASGADWDGAGAHALFSKAGNMPVPQAEAASAGKGLSYSDVCSAGGSDSGDRREARRLAGLKAIQREVRPKFSALVKKYKLPEPDAGDYMGSALRSISFTPPYPYNTAKAKEALAAFAMALEAAALKRAPLPDYGVIKSEMIARIRASGVSDKTKAELVRRVELTELVLPSRYITDFITTGGELWPLIDQLASDQAWNASYDDLGGASNPKLERNQSVVVVFPGMLLAEARGGPHLDFILAHETAHSIDSGKFPEMYAPLSACMRDNFGVSFRDWSEPAADYWADDVIASRAAGAGGLDYLRKSYEVICGTSGEAGSVLEHVTQMDHPSGAYRIENILGRNPLLRGALGLPPENSACRL